MTAVQETTPTARLDRPRVPKGRIEMQAPPEIEPSDGVSTLLSSLLPMLGSVGAVVMVSMSNTGITGLLTGGLFLLSAVGFVAVNGWRQRSQRAATIRENRREYLVYLAGLRTTVRTAARQQRRAGTWTHPDPRALVAVVEDRTRMWERSVTDDDFMQIRLGTDQQPLCLKLEAPELPPLAQLDPVAASAAHRFMLTHETQRHLPASVRFGDYRAVELTGPEYPVCNLARAVVAQAATWHGPEVLRIAVLARPDGLRRWEWVRGLPHAASEKRLADGSPKPMLVSDPDELLDLLPAELSERGEFRRGARPVVPHIIIVDDGVPLPDANPLASPAGIAGVTILNLPEDWDELRDENVLRCSFPDAEPVPAVPGLDAQSAADGEPVEISLLEVGVPERIILVDQLSIVEATAIASRLVLPAAEEEAGRGVGAVSSELVDLLGIGDIRAVDLDQTWAPKLHRDRLNVPIGLTPDNRPVNLDLKEAAQHGMGPHGIIIGATGSGKSEVLRTLVLALALEHSPEQLNFVLVDFKGGATFAGMVGMPHVSAIITNLGEEIALVDRMQEAIQGEMVRRQELLRAAGNFANVTEYEKARRDGRTDLAPLPALLVVIDEFSELLAAKPEFVETFVNIGRLGRSLEVHLLLASQRLEEGKLRGLDSHLSYRIGLRTFSAAESRAVLGVPDAYELPPVPGVGYLKPDNSTLIRFRASYVSGPPVQNPDSKQSTFDLAVDAMRGRGPQAHAVWLPPLVAPNSLDELMDDLAEDPQLGLVSAKWRAAGTLLAPAGLVDKPLEQRRDILQVDLSGAGGHLAVVGGPLSGKSTLLRTVVTGLALTRSPLEAQFYVLDFGGGAFTPFKRLTHVAGVATRTEPETVNRTVAEVVGIIARREAYFREHAIDSIETYRARRARGEVDDGYGDVFLVIDGWAVLRAEFEALEPTVQAIVSQGLTYGVHVLLSAARWMEIRPSVKDLIGTKLEMRLGDPGDSELARKAARNVPQAVPGRGLDQAGLHMMAALPRIDGGADPTDVAGGVEDLIDRVAAAWHGPRPPKLRLLPEQITTAEVVAQAPAEQRDTTFWIGVDEAELAPFGFSPAQEPHLFLYGDSQSGKSSFLRQVAAQIARVYPSNGAKIFAVDIRRSLLGELPAAHLGAYLTSHDTATGGMAELAQYLRGRMPGPDVTPQQLRERSWWSGAEAFVLVDDYDLVATSEGNPLSALVPLLAQAHDIGLHLILTRRAGGASRASYDPVLQRLGDLGTTGILLSGDPEEGPLIGRVKAKRSVPGRAQIVSREAGVVVAQLAYEPPTQQ